MPEGFCLCLDMTRVTPVKDGHSCQVPQQSQIVRMPVSTLSQVEVDCYLSVIRATSEQTSVLTPCQSVDTAFMAVEFLDIAQLLRPRWRKAQRLTLQYPLQNTTLGEGSQRATG